MKKQNKSGQSRLGKKQRIIFLEFWKANEHNFKALGIEQKDAVAIWRDGYVYGRYGKSWER